MPFQRQHLATRIADRLNVVASQLKTRSRASFTDSNHTLEFLMVRFFNALFGWEMVNLNAGKANFPAADLGDRGRRIAIQITSEESSSKIAKTTNTAVEHRLDKQFDQLIIFFLLTVDWTTLGEYLDHVVRRGSAVNVASFVGATTVRVHVVDYDDRPPTAEEFVRMRALVRTAMEEGALGVGSSLI